MSKRTKEQITAIEDARWQLEAALFLVDWLKYSETEAIPDWSEAKEAALIQSTVYLIAQSQHRKIISQAEQSK
jgi:hypothetical protein